MAVRVFDESMMVPDVSLPWEERRTFLSSDFHLVLILLGCYVSSGFLVVRYLLGGGEKVDVQFAAILALVAGFFYFLCFGVAGGAGRIVSVDESGMWLRHHGYRLFGHTLELSRPLHIPIGEVGQIKIAWETGSSTFNSRAMGHNYEGHKLGLTKAITPPPVQKATGGWYDFSEEENRAILLEQVTDPPLNRPWWLYQTAEPYEIATALTLAARSRQERLRL